MRYVIFDFDGVIVDSERTIFKYFQRKLLIEKGYVISDLNFSKKVGKTSEEFLRDVTNLSDDEVRRYAVERRNEFLSNFSNYETVPGVVEEIKRLSKNYKLAICSNSPKEILSPILKYLGVLDYFSFIVGIEDISLPKPNPEIYVKAKKKFLNDFGIDSGFIIEDSIAGIMAAKNSGKGSKVIGITTSFLRKEISFADYVIDSFSELKKIVD